MSQLSALNKQIALESKNFYETIDHVYKERAYDTQYRLNTFWSSGNMAEMLKIITEGEDTEAQLCHILATDLFSHNTIDRDMVKLQLDWWLDLLDTHYNTQPKTLPDSIQESRLANPATTEQRQGKLLSPDYFRHLSCVLEIQQQCQLPEKPNFIELGAGYGGMARVIKSFYPEASYVIVDIPETLYFSSLFLRLNFPDSKVYFVTDESPDKVNIEDYDFVFVPTMFADKLIGNRFDLFANACSLGEMRNEVISQWMDFVQNKIDVSYFFGFNRFLNIIDPVQNIDRLEENICSVSFDPDWQFLRWELEPPLARCPYYESFATRNLLVIAKRKNTTAKHGNQQLSRELSRMLAKEDWFTHTGEDNALRIRGNRLVHDFGLSGTLFKLWNSLRLEVRQDNLSMMLIYLSELMRNKPFEEMFHFINILKNLGGNNMTDIVELTHTQKNVITALLDNELTSDFSLRFFQELDDINPIPKMLEANFNDYHIMKAGKSFIGLAWSVSVQNLHSISEKERAGLKNEKLLFESDSEQELRNIIESDGISLTPKLLEYFRGYNLVDYLGKIYALPLTLGEVNLTEKKQRQRPGIIVTESIEQAKTSVMDSQNLTSRDETHV